MSIKVGNTTDSLIDSIDAMYWYQRLKTQYDNAPPRYKLPIPKIKRTVIKYLDELHGYIECGYYSDLSAKDIKNVLDWIYLLKTSVSRAKNKESIRKCFLRYEEMRCRVTAKKILAYEASGNAPINYRQLWGA